ncbi:MAG: dephospho-CoA kinase [Armatimonadota bacterium]
MIVVGVLGAMGAGKTHVLGILNSLGAVTIQADDVSRELLQPESDLCRRIRRTFGDEYFDNRRLRRGKLAKRIFQDEAARKRLNAIMYPAMKKTLREKIQALAQQPCPPDIVAVEAANLFEMGADELTDVTVNITAARDIRADRIQRRDQISRQEAERRLDSHAAAGLDRPAADFEVNTEKGKEYLWREMLRLYEKLRVRR